MKWLVFLMMLLCNRQIIVDFLFGYSLWHVLAIYAILFLITNRLQNGERLIPETDDFGI